MARLQSEMSFESPDNEKNFPASEEDYDRQGKKKDAGKKKESKKEKKEKGYVIFDEDSEEELVSTEDVKSPKTKKGKPFNFLGSKKDSFLRGKEKEEKKEKEGKKEDKEKKKDDKDGKKHKSKDKKKSKHHTIEIHQIPPTGDNDKPVFGVPLAVAVERNKSHDGIDLPALFRECISYIEEHGLSCEGIYRISGVKSKVQLLKDCYNKGLPVYLEEHEPNIVASLLKQYLRELPEPVLTTALMAKFEEASTVKNEKRQLEQLQKLVSELPTCNRLLLSWMIIHMKHVIERQKENKMSLQNVSIVLSPTMQISHRVLNAFFCHAHKLFKNITLKKYKPPLKPATSRWSLELPDNPVALEEELAKQESLLSQLHEELNTGVVDPTKEEQLWEVQRVVTGLKRKIKLAKKTLEAAEKRKREKEQKRTSVLEEGEEELRLELQAIPDEPATKTEKQLNPQEELSATDEKPTKNTEEEATTRAVSEEGITDTKDDETEQMAGSPEAEDQVTPTNDNVEVVPIQTEVTTEEPSELNIDADDGFEQKVEEILEGQKGEEEEEEEAEMERQIGDEAGDDGKIQTEAEINVTCIYKGKDVEVQAESEQEEKEEKEEKVVSTEEQQAEPMEEEEEATDITNEEYEKMQVEMRTLLLEEEELLAIEDELRKKIETEQSEIGRLEQEIAELQYLRQDSDLEDMSSSSDSSYESEDEDELQDILNRVITENEELEKESAELCQKIHEERMNCLAVKVEIRVLHQNSGHNISL